MRTFVKGFAAMFRSFDWFEWFYAVFILFASTVFWAVVHDLNREINGL